MKQRALILLGYRLYVSFAILLIVLTSIFAGVLISIDLSGLETFNSIFQIIP